ncbi:MAG: hypothetical protein ABIU10_00095 [Sphingomicrobium sp.]
MSGYRQSSYDPDAYERMSGPVRPFNGVQWTGVAVLGVAAFMFLAFLAGELGWTRAILPSPIAALGPMLIGNLMINSRQQPSYDPAPELAPARRRWMIIVTIICAAVLGAATLVTIFTGA